MRCLFGPYDAQWLDFLVADVLAGITVALTLIPQGIYRPIYLFNSRMTYISGTLSNTKTIMIISITQCTSFTVFLPRQGLSSLVALYLFY